MEMQGSRHLAVSQQQAWDALNDPDVLKACIPGCERMEATGEGQFAVGVAVKIGPVAARFAGKVALSDIDPPTRYTLSFDGQGGAAGFGKGQSQVSLAAAADGRGCDLTYTVNAQVGGKIAQMGQRLIDGVAKSMAEDFFKRFDAAMQQRHPEAYAAEAEAVAGAAAAAGAPAPAAPPEGSGAAIPAWLWGAGAVIVAAAVFLLTR
ncbi:CoxG family protein [Ramlibacter sp. MAHUQ-53]|uniref:CoxG family protein n=1 Tax=unclassified Ramlibacter TaxID=2617605 RepID=UPI00362FA1CC